MQFVHLYCADSIFGVFTRFLLILKICTLISFAYCGFTFFAYNMHVFLSTSMKFILTLYLTLRNCSKISVFEFFYFWVISSFLGILTLFLNLLDLFKIVLGSLKYQLPLVLYVSVKKKSKIFHFILFFYKKQLFLAQKMGSNFFGSSQVKMNIRIVFYSLFRSPVQKSVRCPFFFISLSFLQPGSLTVGTSLRF